MKVLRPETIFISSSVISSGMVEVGVGKSFIKSICLTYALFTSRHNSVSGRLSLRYLLQGALFPITKVSSLGSCASAHRQRRFHRWPLQSPVGVVWYAVQMSVVILFLFFSRTASTEAL